MRRLTKKQHTALEIVGDTLYSSKEQLERAGIHWNTWKSLIRRGLIKGALHGYGNFTITVKGGDRLGW